MKQAKSITVYHTLDSFYTFDSKILILGTIPSVKSRELGFYYMHPQNRFWKILSNVFQEEMPITIEDKKRFLKKYHIALWDVLASCEITGSSDSSIKQGKPNDILGLLKKTKITKIYTTGKIAHHLYMKYCYPITLIEDIPLLSPSPANCAFSFEDMVENYQQIKIENDLLT